MNVTTIYIGDDLLDLGNTAIALSVPGYDFTEPSTRTIKYTSTIKLPLTENNLKLCGYSNDINSNSEKPYRMLPCRYLVYGIDMVQNGILVIVRSDDSINVNIYDSQKELFDAIRDRKLNELTFISNGSYKNADIDAFRLATTGVFSPVIDWGVATSASIQSDYYLPTWFYHELVTNSLKFTGLDLSGGILTHTDFTDLVVPFSLDAWEYPMFWRDAYKFYAVNSMNTVTSGTLQLFVQNVIYQGSLGLYNGSGSRLEMPNIGATGNYVTYNFKSSIRYTSVGSPGNSFYFRIVVLRGVTELFVAEKLETMVAPGGGGEFELSGQFNLQDDDLVFVKYYTNSGTPTITVTSVTFQGENTGRIHDNYVFFNYLLPDMTMGELIDDFTNRFGVLYDQTGNTLVLKTLQEVIADKSRALDWTSKRIKKIDPIDFQLDYAQSNSFEYGSSVENNETLGFGYLTIDNDNLKTSDTMFSSPFSNSVLNTILFVNMGRIPVYEAFKPSFSWDQVNNSGGFVQLQFNAVDRTEDFTIGQNVKFTSTGGLYLNLYGEITAVSFSTNTLVTLTTGYLGAAGSGGTVNIVDRGDFDESPGLRLMTLRNKLSTEQAISLGGATRTDYRVAFFDDPAYLPKTTGFQYFVDNYYGHLSVALQRGKSLPRYYMLTTEDIYRYNNQRIIYDDGYFLVKGIDKFVEGFPVKVNELRIF